MPTKNRQGFTLIELLVVISIISLLISVLLPALGSARETSRTISCSNQLRGIGFGRSMYINNDNKGYFPGYNLTVDGIPGNWCWTALLFKGGYLGESTAALTCPTRPNDPVNIRLAYRRGDFLPGGASALQYTHWMWSFLDYGINSEEDRALSLSRGYTAWFNNTSQVSTPTKTIDVLETYAVVAGNPSFGTEETAGGYSMALPVWGGAGMPYPAHGGFQKTNTSYLDGHVVIVGGPTRASVGAWSTNMYQLNMPFAAGYFAPNPWTNNTLATGSGG